MKFLADLDALIDGYAIRFFSAREVCPVGKLANGKGPALKQAPCELWSNIIPTLRVAEWLRVRTGAPIIVLSGYRDPAYNKAVGGSPNSQHMHFRALDIRTPALSPARLAQLVESHPEADRMGIGTYATFVHIDTRGTRSRW